MKKATAVEEPVPLEPHERAALARAIDEGMCCEITPRGSTAAKSGALANFEASRYGHQMAALGHLCATEQTTRDISVLLLDKGKASPLAAASETEIQRVASDIVTEIERHRSGLVEIGRRRLVDGKFNGRRAVRYFERIGVLGSEDVEFSSLPLDGLSEEDQTFFEKRWSHAQGYRTALSGHRLPQASLTPSSNRPGADEDAEIANRIDELVREDAVYSAQRLALAEHDRVARHPRVCSAARRALLIDALATPSEWDGSEVRWRLDAAISLHLHWAVDPPPTELSTLKCLLLRCVDDGGSVGLGQVLRRIYHHVPNAKRGGQEESLHLIVSDSWLSPAQRRAQQRKDAAVELCGYSSDEHSLPAASSPVSTNRKFSPPAIRLTERAQRCLDRHSDRGALVLSVHQPWEPGLRGWAGAWAFASAGRQVLGIADMRTPDFRAANMLVAEAAQVAGYAFRILARKDHTKSAVVEQTLAALNDGGVVFTAIDVDSAGQSVSVPWFLLPFHVPQFPFAAAIRSGADVLVESHRVRPDGTVEVDVLKVEAPPLSADFAVAARWYAQRAARALRQLFRESKAPLSLGILDTNGGCPRPRSLMPLHEWGATTAAQSSVIGWLAGSSEPQGTALIFGDRATSFPELRSLALRFASLVLHYQGNQWPQQLRNQRFLDQHRVLLLCPPGEALAAATLGALAAGSLVSVAQTDLTPKALAHRLREFDPHLIVATASAFSKLVRTTPDVLRTPYLIIDDRGDKNAVVEAVESFDEADALPPVDLSRPIVVTFTSGTSGEPKGAVIPASVHSGGSGIDVLAGVHEGSVLAFLSRWDGVPTLDMFAALRSSATLAFPDNETMQSPSALVTWMKAKGITTLYAPPTLWALVAKASTWDDFVRSGSLVAGMMWGEHISRQVVELVERTAPELTIYCTFGATEMSYVSFGQVTSERLDGYQGSPGGKPVQGVSIELLEEGGAIAEGPDAMLGYFDELADENRPEGGTPMREVLLSDRIRQLADGSLDVLGREDAIIKVGGRRVALSAVETVAERCPFVDRAIAFGIHDGSRMSIQIAVASTRSEQDQIDSDVRNAVVAELGVAARPERVEVFADLPIAASGKLDLQAIAARLNSSTEAAVPADAEVVEPNLAAPADVPGVLGAIERWFRRRNSASFEPDALVTISDSLAMLELLLAIEEVTGREAKLADVLLGDHATWRDVASRIEGQRPCSVD